MFLSLCIIEREGEEWKNFYLCLHSVSIFISISILVHYLYDFRHAAMPARLRWDSMIAENARFKRNKLV